MISTIAAALLAFLPQQAQPPAPPAAPPAAQAKPPVPPAAPAEKRPPWQDLCCYEESREEKEGLVTVIYKLSHTPSPAGGTVASHQLLGLEEFQKMLQPHVTPGKGRIEVSNRLRVLAVTDTKENIAHVEKMLQHIHTPDRPVMIEAKVVELRWDNDLQIGVEGDLAGTAMIWGQNAGSDSFLREIRARFNPTAVVAGGAFQGSTFRFSDSTAHQGTFGGLVQMFVERGRAHILSQPRILVRTDDTATIFAGEEVPYPASVSTSAVGGAITNFTYKPAGVTLEVTPRIAAPGQVSLKIRPEVTTTFGFVQIIPGTIAPQFTVRRVSTELLIRDGEEVVIGGLFNREKTTIRRGLPFLSDIPLLGYLFGKYEDTEVIREILFFIKPTIVKSREDLPRGLILPEK